jgi:4'-phosphopantetheinyl transferase EntD
VAVAEEFGNVPHVVLFPEEEAVIAKAVDKRRREFATARACARAALAKLGLPPVPIVPGFRGAPQWPSGVVGSITHCAGYCASAVAHDRDVVSIGLDAEPHDKLPPGVLDAIATQGEQADLAALAAARPDVYWDRLLFSAKESVYKAWFPLTRRWLGFDEASVDIDPVTGTFAARLLVKGPVLNGTTITGFDGRWLVSERLIATVVVRCHEKGTDGHPGRLPSGGQHAYRSCLVFDRAISTWTCTPRWRRSSLGARGRGGRGSRSPTRRCRCPPRPLGRSAGTCST